VHRFLRPSRSAAASSAAKAVNARTIGPNREKRLIVDSDERQRFSGSSLLYLESRHRAETRHDHGGACLMLLFLSNRRKNS
jgi:hypothetical protein